MPVGSLQVTSSLKKEIGPGAERFGRADGIVIGDGHQVHAEPLELFVDRVGMVVALAAYGSEQGHAAHAGVPSVHVQIAAHAYL